MCAKSPWYPVTGMILALVIASGERKLEHIVRKFKQKRGGVQKDLVRFWS